MLLDLPSAAKKQVLVHYLVVPASAEHVGYTDYARVEFESLVFQIHIDTFEPNQLILTTCWETPGQTVL